MKIKKLLVLIFVLLFGLFLGKNAWAALEPAGSGGGGGNSPYYEKSLNDYQQLKYLGGLEEVHKTRWDATTTNNLVNELTTMIVGTTPEITATTGIYRPGAIGQVNQLVAGLISTPPVNTAEYIADVGSSLGLPIKAAYAQGIGYQALEPILEIWKAFRNVVYMFFVLIFVAVGFMIMFRAKLNPQTVVTIESALPKIVITLLLVTFSYAIASLMVDLIYIAIYLIVGVFSLGGLIQNGSFQTVVNQLLEKSPYTFIFVKGENILLTAPANALENLIGDLIGMDWWESLDEGTHLNLFGQLVKLILSAAVLVSLLKLLFSLLMSYLSIVLSVILAPFQILFNALPGSNAFMGWLKNLFANVIVFPAVAGLFLLAAVLIGPKNQGTTCGPNSDNPYCVADNVGYYSSLHGGNSREIWVPPMMFNRDKGGLTTDAFQALIALGMIMLAPQLVTMIKKMLKVEGTGLGGAIMGGLMTGPRMMGGAVQTGWNLRNQIASYRATQVQKKFLENQAKP